MSTTNITRAFGTVLRDIRKTAGLSQEQLAIKARMDRSYVSLIERGLNTPTLEIIIRLCKATKTPLSVMMAEVEKKLSR